MADQKKPQKTKVSMDWKSKGGLSKAQITYCKNSVLKKLSLCEPEENAWREFMKTVVYGMQTFTYQPRGAPMVVIRWKVNMVYFGEKRIVVNVVLDVVPQLPPLRRCLFPDPGPVKMLQAVASCCTHVSKNQPHCFFFVIESTDISPL